MNMEAITGGYCRRSHLLWLCVQEVELRRCIGGPIRLGFDQLAAVGNYNREHRETKITWPEAHDVANARSQNLLRTFA